MTNKWIWKPLTDEEISTSNELIAKLKLAPVVGRLLVKRGIRTADEARHFFSPQARRPPRPLPHEGYG